MNSTTKTDTKDSDSVEAVKKVLNDYPVGREFDELIIPVENHLRNEIWKRDLNILLKVSALALITLSALIAYTPLYYHLRAIGRISLIQVKWKEMIFIELERKNSSIELSWQVAGRMSIRVADLLCGKLRWKLMKRLIRSIHTVDSLLGLEWLLRSWLLDSQYSD